MPTRFQKRSRRQISFLTLRALWQRRSSRSPRVDFGTLLEGKAIHVLEIPDEYKYMDPELVAQLEATVAHVLDLNAL